MTATIDELAAALRTAKADGNPVTFVHAVLPMWADEVAVRHHPPRPEDGVQPGTQLGEFERAVNERGKENMPDLRTVDNDVAVDGDTIVVKETRVGTLPNGVGIRIPCTLVFTIRDGRIGAYDAYYDEAAAAVMTDYFASRREAESAGA
jgi:ketosteroid isomerase-like protein